VAILHPTMIQASHACYPTTVTNQQTRKLIRIPTSIKYDFTKQKWYCCVYNKWYVRKDGEMQACKFIKKDFGYFIIVTQNITRRSMGKKNGFPEV